MTTYRAFPMADRVVLERDTPSETIISELTLDQADLLYAQLEDALRRAMLVGRTAALAGPVR